LPMNFLSIRLVIAIPSQQKWLWFFYSL